MYLYNATQADESCHDARRHWGKGSLEPREREKQDIWITNGGKNEANTVDLSILSGHQNLPAQIVPMHCAASLQCCCLSTAAR